MQLYRFLLCTLILSCSSQSPPANVAVRFTDVTKPAGIRFKHTNGATGRYYYVETMGPGGAFFDSDGDGDLDVYLANGTDLPDHPSPGAGPLIRPGGPTGKLYRNDGKAFTDVTTQAGLADVRYGVGCVAADYDNDGDQDLYVTRFGPNALYRNDNGRFVDVAREAGVDDPRWGASSAFADYDGDGDLDLFVCNYCDYSLDRDRPCFTGGHRGYCNPDVYDGAPNVLYRNDGPDDRGVWRFTDVTRQAGVSEPVSRSLGVLFLDYDGDADPDIFVANDGQANNLYRNRGDGTFEDVGLLAGVAFSGEGKALAGMGVDAGDFDNDGHPDLVLTTFSFEPKMLYRNNGDGTFTDVAFLTGIGKDGLLFLGFGAGFLDFDNDADLDVLIVNGHIQDHIHRISDALSYKERPQMFRNDRGHYVDVSSEMGPDFVVQEVSRGAAFGDYDDDGDVDLLQMNCGREARLLRNDGGNRSHWLKIKLEGGAGKGEGRRAKGEKEEYFRFPPSAFRFSNRDGIGARVRVTSGGVTQSREVRAGYSYLSGNDLRLHFGLSGRDRADVVEVRWWPSGAIQRLTDVKADQALVIRENP